MTGEWQKMRFEITTNPSPKKMERLAAEWRALQAESRRLDEAIESNLRKLGYGA